MSTPKSIALADGATAGHWWFENYVSPTWTDEWGTANTAQANAALRPTATTTPAGIVALDFDEDYDFGDPQVSNSDSLETAAGSVAPPVGTKSAIFAAAFFSPFTGDAYPMLFKTAADGSLGGFEFYDSGPSQYLYVFGGSPQSAELDIGAPSVSWHRVVWELRGAGLIEAQSWRIYVDGALVYSAAAVNDIPTWIASDIDHALFGANHNTYGGLKLASPFIAYKDSNFTLGTTALAIDAVLASYIAASAGTGGARGSRVGLGVGVGL